MCLDIEPVSFALSTVLVNVKALVERGLVASPCDPDDVLAIEDAKGLKYHEWSTISWTNTWGLPGGCRESQACQMAEG